MSTITYNLGPVALIPLGEGRMFEAGDATIAVFRLRDGGVYATEPWCPHRGGPLADGIVAGNKVVCPLHGFMFDLESGQPVRHECRRLRTYSARLNADHDVLVTMRRRDRARGAEDTPCEPSVDTSAPPELVAQAATSATNVVAGTHTGPSAGRPGPTYQAVLHAASEPPSPSVTTHQGERGAGGVRGLVFDV